LFEELISRPRSQKPKEKEKKIIKKKIKMK
jgi:hypothetical protein